MDITRNITYLLFICLLILACSEASDEAKTKVEICDLEKGPCTKRIGSKELTFYTETAPPQAFKETTFIVSIKETSLHNSIKVENPEIIILNLSMPGMYMGKNQVILKKVGKDTYTGKGIIPRCPTGKTLWQAEITMPDGMKIDFRFHVRY